MPSYTVHQPPLKRAETRRGPENFRFVRDGFYVWAFLLTPLWLIWRRQWLSLLVYLVLAAGLTFGLQTLGLPQGAIFVAQALLSFLVGLEAATLQRWTLRRWKWVDAGVVNARNIEDAERRFFDGWAKASAAPVAAPFVSQPPVAPPPAFLPQGTRSRLAPNEPVIGLFPEPGASR